MSTVSRVVAVLLLASLSLAANERDAPDPALIRSRVASTLSLFEKLGGDWAQPCASCHHQGMVMMALGEARRHGLPVNEEAAHAHAAKTLGILSSADGGLGMTLDAFGFGYMLLAAHEQGLRPTLTTGLLAYRFANGQLSDGSWAATDGRPPFAESRFAATALAIRVMTLYMPNELGPERNRRMAAARRWLASAETESTEDRSFRLLGLAWTGASERERQTAAADLLRTQLPDGGWGQKTSLSSDAYSTGEALFALRQSGAISASDRAFQRGLRYLLDTQAKDGTWHVKTRLYSAAPISPPYVETGFPYNRDQFISCAGTAWAVMALMQMLPEVEKQSKPLPLPEAETKDEEPWMRVALFGNSADLKHLLDAGLDPNTASKGGVPLLQWVMPDFEKAKLLLERGANAAAVAKSGHSALTVAATYRGAAPVIRLLASHGAPVLPKECPPPAAPLLSAAAMGDVAVAEALIELGTDVKKSSVQLDGFALSPLGNAILAGSSDMVRLLLKHGADPNEPGAKRISPLMWAAIAHRPVIAQTLLDAGADPSAKDQFGYTALRHAGDIWYSESKTAEILKKATGHSETAAVAPGR